MHSLEKSAPSYVLCEQVPVAVTSLLLLAGLLENGYNSIKEQGNLSIIAFPSTKWYI